MKHTKIGPVFALSVSAFAISGISLAAPTSKKIKATPEATVASYQNDASSAQTLQPALTAGVSTKTDNTASISSPLDRVYMGLTSAFHGAPIKNIGSEYSVDTNGREKRSNYSTVLFDSEIGAGYRITKSIGAGLVVPFLAAPVRNQGFTLGDVGVKAFDSRLISNGGLRVKGNFIIQAPTSDSSRARSMSYGLKTTPEVHYNLAHSNFELGAYTEFKDYIGVTKDKTFKMWYLPYAAYKLNDRFSLNVGYEMEYHHNVGQKGLGFDTYMTDIQPGVVIVVAKGVIINPYVQLFTMKSVDFDHAAVGAFMSANIL